MKELDNYVIGERGLIKRGVSLYTECCSLNSLYLTVMLLGSIIGIITQIVTYNEKGLFYKTYKNVLTEVYC